MTPKEIAETLFHGGDRTCENVYCKLAEAYLSLLADSEKLRAVVEAAKRFIEHGHPQMTGNCMRDHYPTDMCDCGFNAMALAIKALERDGSVNE